MIVILIFELLVGDPLHPTPLCCPHSLSGSALMREALPLAPGEEGQAAGDLGNVEGESAIGCPFGGREGVW